MTQTQSHSSTRAEAPGQSSAHGDGLARSSPSFVSRTPPPSGQNLADILERVLDKGVVIVGDIQVRLLDIELLTIKIRLMVASVDRAREMGINWWEGDPFVSHGDRAVNGDDNHRSIEQGKGGTDGKQS
ncbi:hypothetical protein GCM10027053_39940 [Intrasporangium mesophilum]